MESLDTDKKTNDGFLFSAGWRLALALLVAVLIIWGVTALTKLIGTPPKYIASEGVNKHIQNPADQQAAGSSAPEMPHEPAFQHSPHTLDEASPEAHTDQTPPPAPPQPLTQKPVDNAGAAADHASPKAVTSNTPGAKHKQVGDHTDPIATPQSRVQGVTLVNAMIKPLTYELEERLYGWRPNDIVQITDNVNNFQVGVLEVTRRATVKLAERISRTGSTDILDRNLERAMNWFMVKADSFWFPAAENKYKDGLKELGIYRDRLAKGEADFYARADNIIPLFKAFTDLLGSCDEHLVKTHEKNGKPVSTFAADDYFYYAKGVASAIMPILEAAAVDFHDTLITRGGVKTLHQAIHACHTAAGLEPLIVTEADLDGILANHRANMASHISHARFYLDVLVNTLST
jgi:hypothetical protein